MQGVIRVGLRALAALPLAAGVYLLAGPLGLPTGQEQVAAGLSFLVGLYVNVALRALGGLADRLFGRTGRDADDGHQAVAHADPQITPTDPESRPAGPGATDTD